MTEETSEPIEKGARPILFWAITALWIGPWVEALYWILRHWAGLPSHGHYVWFAIMYPLPWLMMVRDRERKDTTVLLMALMAYFVGGEAVAIICH
jgi:hypothetical protein